MLPVRVLRRFFLMFLVLRVSAQRATTQRPLATDIDDYPLSNNPFEVIRRQQQQLALSGDSAGSGNALVTAELVLAALSDTFPYASSMGQRHNFGPNEQRGKTEVSMKMLPEQKRPTWKQPDDDDTVTDTDADANSDRKLLSYEIAAYAYLRDGLDDNNGSGRGGSDERAITTDSGSDNASGSESEREGVNVGVGAADYGVNYDGAFNEHTKRAQAASVEQRLWQAIENYYEEQQARSTHKSADALLHAAVKRAPIGGHATRRDYTKNGKLDALEQPSYPYAYMLPGSGSERQTPPLHTPWRSYKREKSRGSRQEAVKFLPSISSGAMTSLGDFFHDLSKNVHFTEKSQLGPGEEKLLDGEHPLRMLHEGMPDEHAHPGKTVQFLHALRTYRPSQKIRSLVAMNPYGYKGSQFIDPNYMWVGLGK